MYLGQVLLHLGRESCHGLSTGEARRQAAHLPGGQTEVPRGSFVQRECPCAVLSRSVVSDSATPRTVACQAPLSMGFSRQEYWSGLPCPPPGDLPTPGIEPLSLTSPALTVGSLSPVPPGKPS